MSITREQALQLAQSDWWVGLPARDVALFQMHVKLLCMPFEAFHHALEEALGRPVWTHELGLAWDRIEQELRGEVSAPTFDQILNLLPEAKRILISVEAERST